jgi:hypothetical protein
MSGFRYCKWCGGRPQGCTFCPSEREKYLKEEERRRYEPIITAKIDDPQEMSELNHVIGADALKHAFGPEGEGVREIERNAAIVNLTRALRKHFSSEEEDTSASSGDNDVTHP